VGLDGVDRQAHDARDLLVLELLLEAQLQALAHLVGEPVDRLRQPLPALAREQPVELRAVRDQPRLAGGGDRLERHLVARAFGSVAVAQPVQMRGGGDAQDPAPEPVLRSIRRQPSINPEEGLLGEVEAVLRGHAVAGEEGGHRAMVAFEKQAEVPLPIDPGLEPLDRAVEGIGSAAWKGVGLLRGRARGTARASARDHGFPDSASRTGGAVQVCHNRRSVRGRPTVGPHLE
jgi:hypothetical protein